MSRRTMYMHTLFGQPAFWCEEDGTLYVAGGRHLVTLHASLRTIRRQQEKTQAKRQADGLDDSPRHYGYVRVAVPTEAANG